MSWNRDMCGLTWNNLRRVARKYYGSRCFSCKRIGVPLEIDHIYPVSKFPEKRYDIRNLQLLCRDCNNEKSDKHFKDYRTKSQKKTMIQLFNNNEVLRKIAVNKQIGHMDTTRELREISSDSDLTRIRNQKTYKRKNHALFAKASAKPKGAEKTRVILRKNPLNKEEQVEKIKEIMGK